MTHSIWRRVVRYRSALIAVGCLTVGAASATAFYWDRWPGTKGVRATGPVTGAVSTSVPADDAALTIEPSSSPVGVPEPTAVVSGLIAIGLFGAWRRRRRNAD